MAAATTASTPEATRKPLLVATPVSAGTKDGGPRASSVSAPASEPTRIETSRRVREEAQSKPIVALNGSTIHSRLPEEAPVQTMVLAAYHEESLPIIVEGVSGSTASVRHQEDAVTGEEGVRV